MVSVNILKVIMVSLRCHSDDCRYAECFYAICHNVVSLWYIIIVNAVMLSVIVASVVAAEVNFVVFFQFIVSLLSLFLFLSSLLLGFSLKLRYEEFLTFSYWNKDGNHLPYCPTFEGLTANHFIIKNDILGRM